MIGEGAVMAASRLGNVLFWASIAVAVFWLYFIYEPSSGINLREDPFGLAVAAAVVLVGWAFRYTLAEGRSK